MEKSNGEGKTYRPGISDLDKEVVPGVTARKFISMSDEERKAIIDVLNKDNPELAKQEAEYVERAKSLLPGFIKIMESSQNDRLEQ